MAVQSPQAVTCADGQFRELDDSLSGRAVVWSGLRERNMARPLSPNIVKALDRLFLGESKEEVVRLLTEQCADNLPNCMNLDEYRLEDLRFEVLKLSGGDIEKLRAAVQLANEDWRDLQAAAGSVRKYKHELLGSDLERIFLALPLLEMLTRALLGAALLLLIAYVVLFFRYLRGPGGGFSILPLAAFTFVGVPAVLGFLAGLIVRWTASAIHSLF